LSGFGMAKKSVSSNDIELHPDAMARFERAVDVVSKSPPQHRAAKKKKTAPKKTKRSKPKP
jgi:hypothetical protein